MKILICLYLSLSFTIFSKLVIADSNLKVLVTIKPFHSLVSAVMEGVTEPLLLLKGNNSPHNYSFKPSSAKILKESDVVFWGGKEMEYFLSKTINNLVKREKLVSLLKIDGLNLLEWRSITNWSKHRKFSSNKKTKDAKNVLLYFDPHIWLDPHNAKIIINAIVQTLSQRDPHNEKIYIENGKKYELLIENLDKNLSLKMTEIKSYPFLVLHDAFQYFEWRYKLNNLGAFELNNSFGMSMKRMQKIRKKIKEEKIICIFSEPYISQKLLKTAVEGTNTRLGVLDPIGANLNNGPDLYFNLLTNLGASLKKCLK